MFKTNYILFLALLLVGGYISTLIEFSSKHEAIVVSHETKQVPVIDGGFFVFSARITRYMPKKVINVLLKDGGNLSVYSSPQLENLKPGEAVTVVEIWYPLTMRTKYSIK